MIGGLRAGRRVGIFRLVGYVLYFRATRTDNFSRESATKGERVDLPKYNK